MNSPKKGQDTRQYNTHRHPEIIVITRSVYRDSQAVLTPISACNRSRASDKLIREINSSAAVAARCRMDPAVSSKVVVVGGAYTMCVIKDKRDGV